MNKRVAGWAGVSFVLAFLAAWGLAGDPMLALRTIGYVGGALSSIAAAVIAVQSWES